MREGEIFTCSDCAGKDFEIRFGGADVAQSPPTVTCTGCRKTWRLSASWPEGVIRLIAPWPEDVPAIASPVVIGNL